MSRIYEALRRAEQERADGSAERQASVGAGEMLRAGAESSPRLGPSPSAPSAVLGVPTDLQSGPQSQPALDSTVARGSAAGSRLTEIGSGLDLEKITRSTWTPVLERLPAVQERGRTLEQFRSLRSRMQELRAGRPLKSILVTSGLPQEGKSFVAVNLAVSLARYKENRVLLIDGDMRRASLDKVLGSPGGGPGLSEYLAGATSLPKILQRASPAGPGRALPHGLASLVLIGAGAGSDKASDLSGNPRFEELMATLSPLFDWIIVDSSPVNLVADGMNLARGCDGVLLIARAGVTRLESAQRAVAELTSSKMLGVVLNAVDSTLATYGYYDYEPSGKTDQT